MTTVLKGIKGYHITLLAPIAGDPMTETAQDGFAGYMLWQALYEAAQLTLRPYTVLATTCRQLKVPVADSGDPCGAAQVACWYIACC
jgi:hypothetical protein